MRARLIIAGIAIACLAGAGVVLLTDGDDSGEEEATETATAIETVDPLPKLARGWRKTANGAGGFGVGVPPGWSVSQAGAKTTLRSPGSAAVVSITADRSDEALETDLGQYAEGLAERVGSKALEDFNLALGQEGASAHAAGYEVEEASGVGRVAKSGRKQEVQVFVVRRSGLAVYPVLFVNDLAIDRRQLDRIQLRLVDSLRGRPVTLGG